MRMSIFAVILLCLAFCEPAHAQGQTGSELLTKCKAFLNSVDKNPNASGSAFDIGFCPGFISGVLSEGRAATADLYCISTDLSAG